MKSIMRQSALCLALAACVAAAPVQLFAQTSSRAEQMLVQKAQKLDAAGHPNLGAQVWKQVLLVDPGNVQAIAALARWEKYRGNNAEAQKYLQRLRKLAPNSAQIGKIESTQSRNAQYSQLERAAQLAREGHPRQAIKVYHQAFGDHPPDNWAQAYYDTEAAIPSMRPDAIRGLRSLVARFPENSAYAVDLGRNLTYTPQTRAEGIRILENHPNNATAEEALRQAFFYSVQNPAYIPMIRAYLRNHPDQQLANALKKTETASEKSSSAAGLARTPAERAAFRDLAANHVKQAQTEFETLHRNEPKNPRVLAGLGFVQMKKQNFSGAISFFSQAEQNGLPKHYIDQGLQTSRFWYAMQRGTDALAANELQKAQQHFSQALKMRPGNATAMAGLAGVYMKAADPEQAIGVYQNLVKAQPKSLSAWRGLFAAEAQADHPARAIATMQKFPAPVRTKLASDPQFLQNLAALYTTMDQPAKARQALAKALNLPGNQSMKTRLQYAGLLVSDGDYRQAAQIFHNALKRDPGNLQAWQGLISIEHQTGHDPHAIAVVEQMPPAVYNKALGNPDFLALLASIYQKQKRYDYAQKFLDRAVRSYASKGQTVPTSLQLRSASLDLDLKHTERAWSIYRSILTNNPNQLKAWQALLAGLHQIGHDADGLAELRQIPPAVHAQLDKHVSFEQTEAGIYAATGNAPIAVGIVHRIQQRYRAQNIQPPAGVEIQDAWVLYNTRSNRDLYRTLMNLGDRTDLTADQRRSVQKIWTVWAVKRAGRDAETGDTHKAIAILHATQRSFPGNPAVTKALAGGYLQAGQPKYAVRLYRSMNQANASAGDYSAMVGAALAAQNRKQAEAWLREGLQKYPRSPKVLAAAARFEQAIGDSARAAAYWKATLRALPQVNPATELAHEMDQPQVNRLARASGLAALLNPNPRERNSNYIPLPGYRNPNPEVAANDSGEPYGPDPYYMGTAPVILPARQRTSAALSTASSSLAQLAAPVRTASSQPSPSSPAAPSHTNTDKNTDKLLASLRKKQNARQEAAMRRTQQNLARAQHPANAGSIRAQYRQFQAKTLLSPEANQPQTAESNLYYMRPPSPLADEDDEMAQVQPMPGASDSQLMQENLPPLHGPYVRPVHPKQKSPRAVAREQLAGIQNGYSGWLGGTAFVNHRSGNPGYDQLSTFDAPIEATMPLGTAARLSLIVNPVFLDSGQATQIPVIGPSGAPELLGSEITAPSKPPAQQNAAGVGGEIQLTTNTFGAAIGYTPYGFLVSNATARLRWKPANGPFTFSFSREAVKDSQLSYSGLRDPASISNVYPGTIWGGVIANSFELQFGQSMANSGYYISAGGQYITGKHVETNHRIDGDAGAYWRVWDVPNRGHLTLGVNLFGMHYAHDLRHFTYGQGGYFSPQAYMLANIPFTWDGHYGWKWHYKVVGAFGIQGFQEARSLYYPIDPALEAKSHYLTYAAQTIVGSNYNLNAEASYHINESWYVGGFTAFNNTRDYNNQTVGFFVRYLFRPQRSSRNAPTGLFPYTGLRPHMVP